MLRLLLLLLLLLLQGTSWPTTAVTLDGATTAVANYLGAAYIGSTYVLLHDHQCERNAPPCLGHQG